MLSRARGSGRIAKLTTDSELQNYSAKVGHHHQAMYISHNPPPAAAFNYISQQVKNAELSQGARFTEKHGNISARRKAKQRASNTRLTREEDLHGIGGEGEDADLRAATLASLRETRGVSRATLNYEEEMRVALEASKQSATPAVRQFTDGKTPEELVESRDAACLKIISSADEDQQDNYNTVVEGLTKPYNEKYKKANEASVRAGQDPGQRADSLAKIAKVSKRTGK